MNRVLNYIVSEVAKSRLKKAKYQSTEFEKIAENIRIDIFDFLRDSFFIFLGVLSAGFGLKGFLLPNMFIDGGVMGISLLLAELFDIPLSVLIVVINLPFLILGFSTISKQFALKSIIAIILLAISVQFIPFPVITDDKLLIAIFGGFFLGLGIGLSIRGGSVIDGTEVLAIFVSKSTSLTIGDVILLFNVLIFSFAAYVLTIEIALYAMLTYLAASKTVDFVVSGIEEYIGVTIISDHNEKIRIAIIENLGRGCTIYSGKGGQSMEEIDIIYTLITRLELAKLKKEVGKIDKEAFLVMHSIKDAKGGMIKKRPLK
jgi:uncharacterized membrane-anchored protein YitT (DUF2179 family)|tara:strand:- start:12132 stop:13079 length:948 start_codon:yes stop_codon:yes gene_type:complete